MAFDISIKNHQAWLGYLQPDGLVVSPTALVDAQVFLDQNILPIQQKFLPLVVEKKINDAEELALDDTIPFIQKFLEWPEKQLYGIDYSRPIPEELKIPLSEFGDSLKPSYALEKYKPKVDESRWLLLGQFLQPGEDLDKNPRASDNQWSASSTKRFERLLRETKVPIGIISNQTHIRLVYAPRGENSGNITFPVSAMAEVSGRPILGALYMLLHKNRLFVGPSEARLPALLEKSREYQSRVSEALSKQVLDSLYELVRGFQTADEKTKGELLREVLEKNPNDVYQGLLTTLLRLVFLLYTEDRGLMPNTTVYNEYYSIHKLFEKLRSDDEKYPDTMDQRYGAWAQLLALFRAVFGGCKHNLLKMPARKGFLFDYERFLFLEGRSTNAQHIPLVSDGIVFKVLKNLLLLDGERLSYRTLDVEQIGSVYETMVGFQLEIASGPTISLKPAKSKGAPTAINIDELLASSDRIKWIREKTDQKLTGEVADSVKRANSIDDILAALERKISRNATPGLVFTGYMILQPSDERRKSGSHYTPRKLTEPIVRKTLEPILQRLGEKPTPQQILDLKVCDIAVGSGAFLVEASRQLGSELVKAWHTHKEQPYIPLDEDEELHARRLVAQRCLYGVDRNPMAVDLTKLSLWLATLAKDHPFTFLDHSIRCGDSLVGLTRKQLADFHWKEESARVLGQDDIEERINRAAQFRKEILESDDLIPPETKRQKLDNADESLKFTRLAGDCIVAAFFNGENDKQRNANRNNYLHQFQEFFKTYNADINPSKIVETLHGGMYPIKPFHWEIEFPEVFVRENGGFDIIIGNPPFAGRTTLYESNRKGYIEWLNMVHVESHGNSDLVAHFYRRAFNIIRNQGSFGLIATNTIGQGDTRATGLRWICTNGGTIYSAKKRHKWPGTAAVTVSLIFILKGKLDPPYELDGRLVNVINAFLFHAGSSENPKKLKINMGKCYQGCVVVGSGFIFDDRDTKGGPSSIADMDNIITQNPINQERIYPYISGEEINEHPKQNPHKFIINLSDLNEDAARQKYPDLIEIVERKVKPDRIKKAENGSKAKQKRVEKWWQFGSTAKDLYDSIKEIDKVIVCSAISKHFCFAILPSNYVYSHNSIVFTFKNFTNFCLLQSRIHEIYSHLLSSTLEDRLGYRPTDCFETFPFPSFEANEELERVGKEYYEYRAQLMIANNEGLTKTYNRFHDPEESSEGIIRLRELHAAMDRAVLDAYGWQDIQPTCEFILDYDEEEDESESTGRTRKKPWRYRWPDEIRDEVLARLLALNEERAKEEELAGLLKKPIAEYGTKKSKSKKKKNSQDNSNQEDLF